MSRDMQVRTTRRSRPIWLWVGASALAVLAIATLVDASADVRRAYPSPEIHAGVRQIEVPHSRDVRSNAVVLHDFDGDGVADELSNEYFHMEPLFERATSGMVQVRSGATNQLLLAHAVATPVDPASWCGDVDGNGTEDVLIEELGRSTVLGDIGQR